MLSQDLIDVVASRLSQGESPTEVKESLLAQGWSEEAIDSVLADKLKQKEPLVWERLPFYQNFLRLDAKSATLSGRAVVGISAGLIFFVVLLSFAWYQVTDPFNFNGVSRDKERDLVYKQLQSGLSKYYGDRGMYPKSLSELVPEYIDDVPNDPKSDKPYDYRAVGDDRYKLCIHFETKEPSADCINTEFIDIY